MDCSKTEVFLREWARMCKPLECKKCPLGQSNNGFGEVCDKFVLCYPQEAIKEVQKWSDEHPRKTRQGEFLKVFPNMLLDKAGVSIICPKSFEGERFECPKNGSSDSTVMSVCDKCGKEYWLAEVE